jgi:ParB-like chromosome segregation protein Spo0J
MRKKPERISGAPELEAAGLAVKMVAIDTLKPDPENAREHNARNLDAITASLKRWGQQKAVVVTRDNLIVAGAGTWEAAKRLGWPRIAVHVTHLAGAEARAYALADNRLGELSAFDESLVVRQLQALKDPDLIAATGFDAGDLADMSTLLDLPAAPRLQGEDEPGGARLPRGSDRTIQVKPTISVKSAEIFERALLTTGLINREDALVAVCQAYLERAKQ